MLNESHNAETSGAISTDASRATVRVIRTDEELMIARSVQRGRLACRVRRLAGCCLFNATCRAEINEGGRRQGAKERDLRSLQLNQTPLCNRRSLRYSCANAIR